MLYRNPLHRKLITFTFVFFLFLKAVGALVLCCLDMYVLIAVSFLFELTLEVLYCSIQFQRAKITFVFFSFFERMCVPFRPMSSYFILLLKIVKFYISN